MKLILSGLLALTTLAPVRAQEKGAWVQLDRDVQAVSAKLTKLVIYEVRDIAELMVEPTDASVERWYLGGVRTLRGFDYRASAPSEPDATANPLLSEAQLLEGTTTLAGVIQANMEPAFDATTQSITVAAAGSLAIVATSQQHAWLARVLQLAKRTTDLVQIETRWISGPRSSFERIGVKSTQAVLTPAELAALLAKLESGQPGADEFTQLRAPSVVARNLQRASIQTKNPIAYVKDWSVRTVQPGSKEIAVPQIEEVADGEQLTLRALRVEQDLYRVHIDIEHSTVKQPIRTTKVALPAAPGGEVEVALPEVDVVRMSADIKLASGAAAVLVTLLDDKHDLALIIKLSTVPNETPFPAPPTNK